MEMTDLGKKVPDYSNDSPSIAGSKPKKTKLIWPSFSISEDQIPDYLDSMEVGQEIRCEVVLRKIGQNENEQYSEDRQDFAIKNIGFIEKAGKKSKDEYMAMDDKSKDEYDQSQLDNNDEENAQDSEDV